MDFPGTNPQEQKVIDPTNARREGSRSPSPSLEACGIISARDKRRMEESGLNPSDVSKRDLERLREKFDGRLNGLYDSMKEESINFVMNDIKEKVSRDVKSE